MKTKKTDFINLSIIFLSSFFVNFYFGSLGAFPIDTFAFFDCSLLLLELESEEDEDIELSDCSNYSSGIDTKKDLEEANEIAKKF